MAIDFSRFQNKNQPAAGQPAPAAAAPAQANAAYDPRAVLAGLNSADAFERNPPFPLGSFIYAIDKVKLFPSNNNPADVFLVEATVQDGPQAGMRCSWIQMIDKGGRNRLMQLGAVKSFVLAVANPGNPAERQAVESATDEIVQDAVHNDGLRGSKVRGTASEVTKVPKGQTEAKTYRQVTFSPAV